MNYPTPYKELLMAIHNSGVRASDIAVSGGFARDTALGAKPNDLDVVVIQPVLVETLMRSLPRGWELAELFDCYEGGEQSEDFDSRLALVAKMRWRADPRDSFALYLCADLLVATQEYDTPLQHIQDNDFNLNHYMIPYHDFLCDAAPTYVGIAPEGILVQCRTSQVTPARHNRMVEKAKAFGWHANIPYRGDKV